MAPSTLPTATSSLLHHRRHHHHFPLPLQTQSLLIPPTNPSFKVLSSSLSFSLARPRHLHLHAVASTFSTEEEEDEYEDEYEDEEEGHYIYSSDDDGFYETEEEKEGSYSNHPHPEPSPRAEAGRRSSRDAGRLFVGNIPYSMTPGELREAFSQAGPVKNVEIIYDRLTDRSRGFAFVTMAGVDEAKSAIRMFDGALLGGRTTKVNFPEVPKGGERTLMGPILRGSGQGFIDSKYEVYAGNLSWTVTSESLRKAFEGVPGVLSAKVLYNADNGRSRGFGFVSFSSQEDALYAIESMNAVEVEGRPLRLSIAKSTASSGSSST